MSVPRSIRWLVQLLGALLLTLVVLSLLLVAPLPVQAATLVVTNGTDTTDGTCDADCSLREAIIAASAGDIITFADDVATVTLTSAQLTIDKDLTIDGGAGVTIQRDDTAGDFRIFEIIGSDVTLDRLTIRNGSATNGGGIYNDGTVTVTNSTIRDNTATGSGGGIANDGTVTVTSSTIRDNTATGSAATGSGGGIANSGDMTVTSGTISGNIAAIDGGGGILNRFGTLTVINSTINGNTAATDGSGILNRFGTLTVTNSTIHGNEAQDNGGGIATSLYTLEVINSTISGNTADNGGGIHNDGGNVTVTSSTISDNEAQSNGGGIDNDGGTTTIANTIVAGNMATMDDNIDGSFTEQGANLTAGDPLLGPLQDNGGPTLTHLPLDGSPAIDTGDDTMVPVNLTSDQRGFRPRVVGSSVDIGAVEIGVESVELLYLPLVQVRT
jgi:CSLREA domain-containing protein